MVTSVQVAEMPDYTDKDGNVVLTIPQLYEDLLVSWMGERLLTADEYLDEVRPSGWKIAPTTPDHFQELLSDHPYTEEFDSTNQQSGGHAREEFNDWPDDMLTFAKKIEEAYGVEGDTFTYDDLKDLSGVPYSDNSIPVKMKDFRDADFVTDSGDRRDGKKLFVWVTSWDRNNDQQDPVADGGVNEYDWAAAIETMETADVARGQRDWFTSRNFESFIEIYRHIQTVNKAVAEIRNTRQTLTHYDLTDGYRTVQANELKGQLTTIKREFQDIFSLLKGLVVTAHRNITQWAEVFNVDLHNEIDRYRPHKRQDKLRQRVEAKRFALIDTYLTALLTYPEHVLDVTKLEAVEDVVDAFMLWLWMSYEAVTADAEVPEVAIEDLIQNTLDTQKDATGDDYIEWTTLAKRVMHDHPDDIDARDVLRGLRELHRHGKASADYDHRGLHLYDIADKSDDPELVVEIVYNGFERVDFDEDTWRSELLRPFF